MRIRFTIGQDNKIEYYVLVSELKEIDKNLRCSICGKLEEKLFVRGIDDRDELFCERHKPDRKKIK